NFNAFPGRAEPPPVTRFIELNFDAHVSENTPETTAGTYPVGKIWIGTTRAGKAFARVNNAPELVELEASGADALIKSASQSAPAEANPVPSPTP
ncbi:MAG TPA: hypothetical protein VIS74_04280, partial [Chthoniobacterales bacterium]